MNNPQSDDEQKVATVRHLLAFLAILVIMVAQVFLFTQPYEDNILALPTSFWVAIGATLAGVALFILSQVVRPPARLSALLQPHRLSRQDFWSMLALTWSVLAVLLMLLLTKYGRNTYLPVLTFWFFAAMCYIAAYLPNLPPRSELLDWLRRHRNELLAIGLVTLLGGFLRFYELGTLPRVLNGDEGRVGLTAMATNQYPYVNPFSLWENFGGLYLQVINIFLNLFGASSFSLRLAAAIGGTLAIPALYLLGQHIAGRRIALVAAFLLTIAHVHINFSRTIAVAYIQGTWLIPLELYFLLSGLERRSSWRTALAGVLLAIHFSVYLDAQIIAGLVLVFMLLAFWFLGAWFRPAVSQALTFWGGFIVMIIPEAIYSSQQPALFFDRLHANGTFQTGWLAQAMADTGQGAVPVLAERILHAFLSIFYYPSFDFYGSPFPMLSLITALLFLIGLGVVLWKTGAPGFLLLNGYFWAGTVAIGIFSIPPSADTYRMLIVLPAVVLMAAIGLDGVLSALGFAWSSSRRMYTVVTATTLLSLLVFNMWIYYVDFAGRCLYGSDSPPARFASYLGNYTHSLNKEDVTYLLSDATYFYGSHPSVDFLSGGHPITNVEPSVDTLPVRPGEAIIASPDRIAELRGWAEIHPGGELHYEYDCQRTILLAYRFP